MSDLLTQYGSAIAIIGMGLVTYLCRISGVVLMSYITITPAVKRSLYALPGSIVLATILPLATKIGGIAFIALFCAVGTMIWRKNELLALICGLGVVILLRWIGI